MIKDEKKRLPQYLDGLDNEELEKLRNDTSIENWRKNFILRFYEQLSLKELSKKDVCKNVSSIVAQLSRQKSKIFIMN